MKSELQPNCLTYDGIDLELERNRNLGQRHQPTQVNSNNQDLSDEYPLDMVINMDFFGEIIKKSTRLVLHRLNL